MLPTALTEPLCFCHVDGCRKAGGAKMAVGDGAAWCRPKAPFASSGDNRRNSKGPKMDRIPERLRTAAEGVAKATQMMADAKSRRNREAGDDGSCYTGLKREQTAEWKAAELLERYEAALREIANGYLGDQTAESQFIWAQQTARAALDCG